MEKKYLPIKNVWIANYISGPPAQHNIIQVKIFSGRKNFTPNNSTNIQTRINNKSEYRSHDRYFSYIRSDMLMDISNAKLLYRFNTITRFFLL